MMSRNEAMSLLKEGAKKDGDFVTRLSGSEPGNIVVSCIYQNEFFHFVLKKEPRGYVYAKEVRGQDLAECIKHLRTKNPVTTPDFRQFWLCSRYGKNGAKYVHPKHKAKENSPKKKRFGIFGKKRNSATEVATPAPQNGNANTGTAPAATTTTQDSGGTFDPFAQQATAANNDPFSNPTAPANDPFGSAPASNAGGTFDPFAQPGSTATPANADPFGAPTPTTADPFGAPTPATADPFGAPTPATADPFGAPTPATADPFGAAPTPATADPFGAPTPATADPFGAAPATTDPFGAPFGTPASISAPVEDPTTRLTLTADDVAVYDILWTNNSGGAETLPADAAVTFFRTSGLEIEILHNVWEEADMVEPLGELNKDEFFNAIKMIALAQVGLESSMGNLKAKAPLPFVQGMPDRSRLALSEDNFGAYSTWWADISKGATSLDASTAVSFFQTSGLDNVVLKQVWDDSDMVEPHGELSQSEFFTACKMISLLQAGTEGKKDMLQNESKLPEFKTEEQPTGIAAKLALSNDDVTAYDTLWAEADTVDEFLPAGTAVKFLGTSSLGQADLGAFSYSGCR